MTFLNLTIHWISGAMLGIELLSGDDYIEESNPVRWGIVVDLVILRIILLVHDYERG